MRNRKPTFQVRASAVNSVSHKSGATFAVIASNDLGLPKDVELAAFGCEHCGTVLSAIKDSEPFCVTCGSDQVALATDQLAPEVLSETQELSSVICSCNSHNIISDVVAAKLGGKMHCITCGDALEFDQPDGDDGDDLPEVGQFTAEASGDDVDLGPEGEITLDGDDAGAIMEGANHASNPDPDDLHPPIDAAQNTTSVPFVAPEIAPDAEFLDMPMTDALPEMVGEDFEVSCDESTMVASVNGTPVATLKREQAANLEALWGKQSLVRSVKAAVAQEGRSAALAHFGFIPIVASFPLKKLVDERVAAAMEIAQATVTSAIENLREDYRQCLAIAAAGLQKDFFKGHDHPLKAALFENLAAAGVRSPAAMVDKVFAGHGAAYIENLLVLAEAQLAKPLEVRNELALTVESANYMNVAEVDEGTTETAAMDDTAEPSETSVSRMQSHAGLRIKNQTQESASIRDITKGKRLFGSQS